MGNKTKEAAGPRGRRFVYLGLGGYMRSCVVDPWREDGEPVRPCAEPYLPPATSVSKRTWAGAGASEHFRHSSMETCHRISAKPGLPSSELVEQPQNPRTDLFSQSLKQQGGPAIRIPCSEESWYHLGQLISSQPLALTLRTEVDHERVDWAGVICI